MSYSLTITDIEKIISKIPKNSEFEEILQNLNEIRNGMFLTNRDIIYLRTRD
ncbi:hypothetical protein AAA799B03_01184 [Marine Group I thaumarchaeote SCGC AAA799-B03]|uniref:Uncharacterized protein n=2 Tax=Marine Group I TaxID=905826 RepID=A0A087S6A8_9ARCH|nr:hypothetical protein SCCGRSA3_01426 [Marine Group I thaumarchaeote SCGC RSA3]KFM21262.1 hypothetical protein AAA799B03_01184 [Marine Group I thaumarchaeote SCGC AAA799-B03]